MEAVKRLGGLANFDVFAYRAANLDDESRKSLLDAISRMLEDYPDDALPAEVERLTVERLLREYHAALVEHGVKDYDYASFVLDYERGLLTILMTIASTDNMEMGEGRGADLIRLWVERLVARARHVDLDGLL